jgi:hypothetical protein
MPKRKVEPFPIFQNLQIPNSVMCTYSYTEFYPEFTENVENILVYKSQQDAQVTEFLFCLRTALHVSGFTVTHLQEHKTTVTTVSGNHYTVIDRVKFY